MIVLWSDSGVKGLTVKALRVCDKIIDSTNAEIRAVGVSSIGVSAGSTVDDVQSLGAAQL